MHETYWFPAHTAFSAACAFFLVRPVDKTDHFVYTVYVCYIQTRRLPCMNIIISNADGKPIYEQIAEQIKHAILTG